MGREGEGERTGGEGGQEVVVAGCDCSWSTCKEEVHSGMLCRGTDSNSVSERIPCVRIDRARSSSLAGCCSWMLMESGE